MTPMPECVESTSDSLREDQIVFVAEAFDCIRINAEIGLLYIQAGDAVGLAYSALKMAAYMRAAIPIVKALAEAHRAGNSADTSS